LFSPGEAEVGSLQSSLAPVKHTRSAPTLVPSNGGAGWLAALARTFGTYSPRGDPGGPLAPP